MSIAQPHGLPRHPARVEAAAPHPDGRIACPGTERRYRGRMGIFDSLKRVFNISGARITVTLDDPVCSQHDHVSGEVLITGRELEQSGDDVARPALRGQEILEKTHRRVEIGIGTLRFLRDRPSLDGVHHIQGIRGQGHFAIRYKSFPSHAPNHHVIAHFGCPS